jgi:hypothetical protein
MCKSHDLITAIDRLHLGFLDDMAIFLEQTQNWFCSTAFLKDLST